MRWLKRLGLTLVAALALFAFGWAPYYLAGIATTRRFQFPDKENAGLTPASFQLAFEDVSFKSADGVVLKGWWVPAENSKGTAVLLHGLNRSRIEMARKLPFLREQGWNALLFDQRHHGESGGDATTFGAHEKQDARAAVAWARARSPVPVVLWGVSLGGATATLAAAEEPQVAGVVCDSSYRSLSDTVRHHLNLFRGFRWWLRVVPSWPVVDEVLFWMGRRAGFDATAIDVLKAAGALHGRPALFVCNSDDRRMPKEIAFELQAAAGPQAKVLVVPGRSHGGAWRDGTEAYGSAVAGVLRDVEAGGGTSPAVAGSSGGRQ
ncbi:MAG: alpha/beta hydrolase [Vicinamibacteria bacterium]